MTIIKHFVCRLVRKSARGLEGWRKTQHYHAVSDPSYLVIDESCNRKIRYQKVKPDKSGSVGLVFIHGFQSNMDGAKAHFIDQLARDHGLGYVRFDLEGARVSGDILSNMKFSHYIEDCLAVIDKLTEGPQVVVGSSLGGWLAIHTALRRPDVVKGLVLVAPAINFMRDYFNRFYNSCPKEAKDYIDSGGTYSVQTQYGPISMNKAFTESSYEYELNFKHKISVECPVRIIHGMLDDAVPYQNSIALLDALGSGDVDIFFRKAGSHRLCEPGDLELIRQCIENTFINN